MRLGRTYRLGGDFKVIIWEASHKGMGPILLGELILKTTSKDVHLEIGGGIGWMKWLKNAAEKGFIFHAVIPALYPFW